MREIYLPAFEAAVIKGHVDAVMNSYNEVNGVHATQNEFLNLKLLKGEWRFDGVLMSDWTATYDGVAAANNGLDLEMPKADFMNAQTLIAGGEGWAREGIDHRRQGAAAAEDGAALWIHGAAAVDAADAIYSLKSRAVALQGALESMTLLKNESHTLPLDPAKIKSIAMIGPNAWPTVTGGGGSSEAHPFDTVNIVTGVAEQLGPNVRVLYSRGLPDTGDVFRNTHWEGDVKVEAFANRNFMGTPATGTRRAVFGLELCAVGAGRGRAQRALHGEPSRQRMQAGICCWLRQRRRRLQHRGRRQAGGYPGNSEGGSPQALWLNLTAGQIVHVVTIPAARGRSELWHGRGLRAGPGVSGGKGVRCQSGRSRCCHRV